MFTELTNEGEARGYRNHNRTTTSHNEPLKKDWILVEDGTKGDDSLYLTK